MARRLSAADRKAIEQRAAKGETQRAIARKVGVSLASVNRVLNEAVGETVVAPAASVAELAAMSAPDRLEAQLATLDQVLVQPGVTPALRARLLTTYSNLLDRAAKIRGRESKGERQFDGLADLLLSASHSDAARWSTNPTDWLADVVPRQLPELHEVAGALERVPAEARRAAAERMRPVLHRILALLDAI